MRRTACAVAALSLLLGGCGGVPEGPPVDVGVPPGSSLGRVADSLESRGVIAGKTWFRWYGRLRGADRQLRPGIYRFTPGESVTEILDRLSRGDDIKFMITLPEGGTIRDLARNTERRLGIPRDEVMRAASDSATLATFGITTGNAEGWLFPETFAFNGYATARDVVGRFLRERQRSWPAEWQARGEAAGLDRTEILTLASIVEGEARHEDEMPLIAAVYRNRLRIGMPLQADPTIQYAFLVDSGARKPRLFNRDYSYRSPYNTYLHAGLPPGPIGNPSTAAIEAVLSPAEVPYLYFVAKGDGYHQFSRTYQEHLRAIRQIRGR